MIARMTPAVHSCVRRQQALSASTLWRIVTWKRFEV